MIDGKNVIDQPIKKDLITYESIRQIATIQGDDYTTGHHYKMIAIDLSKQQEFDADPKAIQQITFTENLDKAGQTTMFSSLKKQKKKNILDFSLGNIKVLWMCYTILFCFNIISV